MTTTNTAKNTLIAQLHSYLSSKGEYDAEMETALPFIMQPFGQKHKRKIIIAAKNAASLRAMNYILKQRMVKKYYLALCRGVFENKQATLTAICAKTAIKTKYM
jgi:23S rRNA pseudouridine955/2504/2580 synthase